MRDVQVAIRGLLDGTRDYPDSVFAGRTAGHIERLLDLPRIEPNHIGEIVTGEAGLGKKHDPAATFARSLNVAQRGGDVRFERLCPMHLYAGNLHGHNLSLSDRNGVSIGIRSSRVSRSPMGEENN